VRRRLFGQHRVEVPCFEHAGRPLLRISVQGYNDESDVERLLAALPTVLYENGGEGSNA
jgi:selenocysteine lyase/cysteine desulfurase